MYPYFLLLIIILIFLLNSTTTTTHPPRSSHSAQPPSPAFFVHFSQTPPPSSPQTPPSHQLNDSLLGAGDFAGWAHLLSSTDPSTLPIAATLFIPTNDAITKTANSTGMFVPDTFLIPYHIVPQRLTFSDLRKCHVLSKLPTLLPTKFIVVTNASAENFMIDGVRITHPDLYLTGSFAVHGVKNVLDYEVYGNCVLKENGMLAKNEMKNKGKRKPVKGDETVVVSLGDWLDSNVWINSATVTLCIMVIESTVLKTMFGVAIELLILISLLVFLFVWLLWRFAVMVFVAVLELLILIFVSVLLLFVALVCHALREFCALLGCLGIRY